MKKSTNLKEALAKKHLIRIVGAHNGLTARLVERAGFDGVWASGFEISTAHAVPDANILTMSDFLSASLNMVTAVSIPVIADCDTGFGNSNNVMYMVRRFESAGTSAICIEDKRFPKVNSFISGRQELAPVAEFVGKITAAKNARIKKEFMIFARVEALVAGFNMQEALRRAIAYVDAGADGIFIHSKSKSPDEIISFCKVWKARAPIIVCPTTYSSLSESAMQRLGVNIVIYANQGIRAAIKYTKDILDYIRERGIAGLESKIATMEEVFHLQDMHIMKDQEKKYLRSEVGTTKAIIPAAGADMDRSLKILLEDRPIGMLDINGKTLFQRNIETLNKAGIQDINVIVGYRGENVAIDGAKIIKNPHFKTKGIMHSIISGLDSIADKNIVIYSDIIVDQHLLEKLMRREDDIVLVVDDTYKKTHLRNKKLELVLTKMRSASGIRTIDVDKRNPIRKIGKDLSAREAHCEFIGLALLSRKGMTSLMDEFKPAKGMTAASFADFVQYLIGKGHEVFAHEVTSGWMEVHNLGDYKRACSIFS